MIEETIIKYVITFLLGGILGLISTFFKKNKALSKAVQSLLRDRLIEKYRLFIAKGEMTILDRENIDSLYAEYVNLGGNGMIKELMEELHETKTKVIKE